jgi:hypothetical protein
MCQGLFPEEGLEVSLRVTEIELVRGRYFGEFRMSRFDVFLIGSNQSLPLEVEAENVQALSDLLTRQRFLVGRFSAEAGDQALRLVSIPISRINLFCEAE